MLNSKRLESTFFHSSFGCDVGDVILGTQKEHFVRVVLQFIMSCKTIFDYMLNLNQLNGFGVRRKKALREVVLAS